MHHCSNENIDTFRLGADEGAKEKALTELIDKCLLFLVDEAGFEPATFGFGGQHSIQLSYPSVCGLYYSNQQICSRLLNQIGENCEKKNRLGAFSIISPAGTLHMLLPLNRQHGFLQVVAGLAGGDEVVPGGPAASGERHQVIHGQFLKAYLRAAIMA